MRKILMRRDRNSIWGSPETFSTANVYTAGRRQS